MRILYLAVGAALAVVFGIQHALRGPVQIVTLDNRDRRRADNDTPMSGED